MKTTLACSLLAIGLATGTIAGAQGAVFNWTGATSNRWDVSTNWSSAVVPNDRNTAEVRIETEAGLSGDSHMLYLPTTQSVRSLYVNLPVFTLRSNASRTLLIGDGGMIHFGEGYTAQSNAAFSIAGASGRFSVMGYRNLTLRNDGSGSVGFGVANLQNHSASPSDGTFTFTGSGNWDFGNASYLGKVEGGSYGVSLVLAEAFSGTVTYGAKLPAQLKDLLIANGTFVANAKVALSGKGVVAKGGTLGGTGTVDGDMGVRGTLRTGGPSVSTLTFDGNLTLFESATTRLRLLVNGSADTIKGTGELNLGGALRVIGSSAPNKDIELSLYEGFRTVNGTFNSVSFFDTSFEKSGDGKWVGVIGNYQYEFNEISGKLRTRSASRSSASSAVFGVIILVFATAMRSHRQKHPGHF